MNVNLVKKSQSSAQALKGMTLMRRTLIMCVHESRVSSAALSRLAVSKSWAWVGVCADYTIVKVEPPTPSPVCYKYSYAIAHTLCRTNRLLKDVSQPGAAHRTGKTGETKGKRSGKRGRLGVSVHKWEEACEIYHSPFQTDLWTCENVVWSCSIMRDNE